MRKTHTEFTPTDWRVGWLALMASKHAPHRHECFHWWPCFVITFERALEPTTTERERMREGLYKEESLLDALPYILL